LLRAIALNVDMGRCVYCHGVVTRDEDSCYNCGDSVRRPKIAVSRRPLSGWINTAFIGSLGILAYFFFAEHLLSLPATVAISSALLMIRILIEWLANRSSH
jgi:hypothetical protein